MDTPPGHAPVTMASVSVWEMLPPAGSGRQAPVRGPHHGMAPAAAAPERELRDSKASSASAGAAVQRRGDIVLDHVGSDHRPADKQHAVGGHKGGYSLQAWGRLCGWRGGDGSGHAIALGRLNAWLQITLHGPDPPRGNARPELSADTARVLKQCHSCARGCFQTCTSHSIELHLM